MVVVDIHCHRSSSHFVGSHLPHSRTKLQHDLRNTCTLSLLGTFWCYLLLCNRGGVKEVVFVDLLFINKPPFHRVKLDHIISGFEVRVSHYHRQLIFTTDFLTSCQRTMQFKSLWPFSGLTNFALMRSYGWTYLLWMETVSPFPMDFNE